MPDLSLYDSAAVNQKAKTVDGILASYQKLQSIVKRKCIQK